MSIARLQTIVDAGARRALVILNDDGGTRVEDGHLVADGRPAPLPSLLRDAVSDWLAERDKCLAPDKAPEALLIDDNGRRMRTGTLRYRIRQMAKATEVELVPHQLRHTFVTEAKRRRTDLSLLRTIVGHTREQTTGLYTHLGGIDAAREASEIRRRVLRVRVDQEAIPRSENDA